MRIVVACVACFGAFAAAASQGTGWFGFSIGVDVSLLMNLDSATINHVFKPSPAEKAGVAEGDAIIEVEGCRIPGCGAYKAKRLLEKPVGESVNLRLRRPNGEEYAVHLTAEPEPAPTR